MTETATEELTILKPVRRAIPPMTDEEWCELIETSIIRELSDTADLL